MSAGPPIGLLIVLALGAVLGAWLVLRGWRPRRTGSEPHCAQCLYSLIGNESGRCPECGADLTAADAVVHGRRVRRPRTIATGSLIFALCLVLGSLLITRNTDWYGLKPTGWVLDDLEAGGGASGRAWTELKRRVANDALSAEHRSRLIDLALKEQAKYAPTPMGGEILSFLGDCALKGHLSEGQKTTFIDQIVSVNITVRPKVRVGDYVPYSVSHRAAAPGQGWWCELEVLDIAMDGKTVTPGGGKSGFSGGGSSGSFSSSVQSPGLGKHTLSVKQRLRVYSRPSGASAGMPPFAEREMTSSAEVEVVPADAAPAIKRVAGTDLADTVRAAISPQEFMIGETQPGMLSGKIVVKAAPAGLAFDVFVRVGGKEHRMGSLTQLPGRGGTSLMTCWEAKFPNVPASIDLVLRASEKKARETVALEEFFDGEIVFEDVPVTPGPMANDPIPEKK